MNINELVAEINKKGLLRAGASFEELMKKAIEAEKENNELKQQLAAVVAENAGLKSFIKTDCYVAHVEPETFYEEEVTRYVSADGYESETPATDAYLAELRAQIAEEVLKIMGNFTSDECGDSVYIAIKEFAAQLRQGAEHE